MLYTPLKSNIYLSGMSCISCKEIAFLTIINLKNANFSGALPQTPPWARWGGAYSPPQPPSCSYLASLPSLGLPCFLLISVLMPEEYSQRKLPLKMKFRYFPLSRN